MKTGPAIRFAIVALSAAILISLHAKDAGDSKPAPTPVGASASSTEAPFALRGVIRQKDAWEASLTDRKTGETAWVEKNQLVRGYSVREIAEKFVVLVERETGKAVTLHLEEAKIKEAVGSTMPVLERSTARDTGGVANAATVAARFKADSPQELLEPRVAPPVETTSASKPSRSEGAGSKPESGRRDPSPKPAPAADAVPATAK